MPTPRASHHHAPRRATQSVGYSSTMLQLIERLQPLMPKAAGAAHSGLDSFFFANSGAEAVENALRLARQATGKDNVIAFSGGYHGRTSATVRRACAQPPAAPTPSSPTDAHGSALARRARSPRLSSCDVYPPSRATALPRRSSR